MRYHFILLQNTLKYYINKISINQLGSQAYGY